jgi:hypothetical protein
MPARTCRSTSDHSRSTASASTSAPRWRAFFSSMCSACARASRALGRGRGDCGLATAPGREIAKVRAIAAHAIGKREIVVRAHEDAELAKIADGARGYA